MKGNQNEVNRSKIVKMSTLMKNR